LELQLENVEVVLGCSIVTGVIYLVPYPV
jgi:hypothetical protein